jgi:hypothetical protein
VGVSTGGLVEGIVVESDGKSPVGSVNVPFVEAVGDFVVSGVSLPGPQADKTKSNANNKHSHLFFIFFTHFQSMITKLYPIHHHSSTRKTKYNNNFKHQHAQSLRNASCNF